MINNLHKITKCFILVLTLFLAGITTVHAQLNRTKIQDASISAPNTPGHEGALLELESNNKGMLVPRMTTGQRDAIETSKLVESLFIYNTTTGCFNYWSVDQDAWLSLCGTPPPAVFSISTVQCGNIVANGVYKQGDPFTSANFLSVPVTVSQPGTYSVIATTSNGYFFTDEGTFPNAGSYVIQLKGTGTPNMGYDPPADPGEGDSVTLNLNGTVSNCSPIIFVEKANVSFQITCGSVNAEGNYYIGITTNETNYLKVIVDVQSTGFWNMFTPTINGVSFSATGVFTSTGIQEVHLLATGTPIASGPQSYSISSNSDPVSSCTGIQLNVAPVAYTIDCANAVVNGSYMQAVPISAANSITLPINVTATGNTTISTTQVNGISFTTGPIILSALGQQNVILLASGTPTNGVLTTLNLTGTPGATGICSIEVPVSSQPVAYVMTCSSIATTGSYAPGLAMSTANTMTVNVSATYPGNWSITTDTQNGVYFSGSGTLTTGTNTLTLQANGTPASGGVYTFTLTSNSASGSTTCTKNIQFVYRTMRVLGLGGGTYQPGSASASQSSKSILLSQANFSANGTFPVQSMSIINGATPSATALRTAINTNNIDIIVIGYNYTPNADQRAVLIDFVENKKGVLIHSQENDAAGTAALINAITGGSTTVSGTGTTYYNPTLNVEDPILNGPFGDYRNRATGSDVNNSYYVANLPSTVEVLARNENDASRAHIFRHKTKGYMYIGDSGWTSGDVTNTSTTTWPARSTATGVPLSKVYTGGTVYNSFIYANAMAWAIKYAQENTITTYLVQ